MHFFGLLRETDDGPKHEPGSQHLAHLEMVPAPFRFDAQWFSCLETGLQSTGSLAFPLFLAHESVSAADDVWVLSHSVLLARASARTQRFFVSCKQCRNDAPFLLAVELPWGMIGEMRHFFALQSPWGMMVQLPWGMIGVMRHFFCPSIAVGNDGGTAPFLFAVQLPWVRLTFPVHKAIQEGWGEFSMFPAVNIGRWVRLKRPFWPMILNDFLRLASRWRDLLSWKEMEPDAPVPQLRRVALGVRGG